MAQLKRRRGGGPDLLAFKRGRAWVDVRSDDINDYIKEQTGGDFTAKDFRTWSATVLAAVAMANSFPQARSNWPGPGRSAGPSRRSPTTWATPRRLPRLYIDPRVFDRYRSGLTIAGALELAGRGRLSDRPTRGRSRRRCWT